MPPATAGRTGVVIVGASRTPLCSLGGQLSSLSAGALGGAAIAGALAQGGVPASAVDACHMGHVLTAGAGQAPARQAATAGGLGERVVCTSVSKACASGLTAIVLGCMEIQLGVR
jgi:acetyl-CoA C-acetyltransferase